MAEEAPPSFAASVEASRTIVLPGYEEHRSPIPTYVSTPVTERVYTLETAKKQPWAFLKVNSRGGRVTSVPLVLQGEPITGTVELDLEKTEHIQEVVIETRGESLAVGQEPMLFLTQETTLWSTTMGDPGNPSVGVNGSPKLKGKYVWPFSITLPDKVTVSAVEKGPTSVHPLPPAFSERASPSYLEYKIIVTFRRGRFRVDNTLSTSLAYVPRSRPPPASELRQLAYQENSAAPGPKVDPEGWESLGTKSVTGTVFDSREVEVACVFHLAKPLSYARGTTIPFVLTLSCSDRQALDLFAARGSLAINLTRSLFMGADATDENRNSRSNNTFTNDVGQGVYWPAPDDNTESETRKLEGEIPVHQELKPSFFFPRMVVKYHVSFALAARGFVVTSNEGVAPIFSREVEIATVIAPGPAPRSRIPIDRLKGDSQNHENYDVSIGMLTGANQRFLHHHGFG
ncbi:hypothetical protein K439DRAFT_1399203 [Ramaria rubella]|nr:hypothetical protein K439DRAFT_1399203 [Ramaria rubella]